MHKINYIQNMFFIFTCRNKITKLVTNVAVACCTAAVTTLVYNHFHKEEQEAIFFYGNQSCCDYHRGNITTVDTLQHNECSLCKINKIIEWLSKAKKTLSVCIYSLTNRQLANAIIDAHKRGVLVRVIVNDNRVTWDVVTAGIPKRTNIYNSHNQLMHHKFFIIDSKYVILGSLNWTDTSVRHNWDHIFVSNEQELVNPFMKEFQNLWTQFGIK